MENRHLHRMPQRGRRPKEIPSIDILKLHPPGFQETISVPFPDRKLPVCFTCKRNYKTRELCRTRDGHTGLPWTTTYICITLDKNCIDGDGKLRKDVEIKARSLSTQQNFCFKRDVDVSTAICHACKEKNYTRQYCREKLKHRQLPWPSAYARLSASTKEIDESKRVKKNKATKVSKKAKKDNDELEKVKDEKSEDKSDQAIRDKRENDSGTDDSQSKETPVKKIKTEEGKEEDFSGEEDDTMFEQIPEPSTFLAIVSSKGCTYEWLVVDHSAPPANQVPKNYPSPFYPESQPAVPQGFGQEYPYYGYPPTMPSRGGQGSYPPHHSPHGYSQYGGYGYAPPQPNYNQHTEQHLGYPPYYSNHEADSYQTASKEEAYHPSNSGGAQYPSQALSAPGGSYHSQPSQVANSQFQPKPSSSRNQGQPRSRSNFDQQSSQTSDNTRAASRRHHSPTSQYGNTPVYPEQYGFNSSGPLPQSYNTGDQLSFQSQTQKAEPSSDQSIPKEDPYHSSLERQRGMGFQTQDDFGGMHIPPTGQPRHQEVRSQHKVAWNYPPPPHQDDNDEGNHH